MICTLSRHSVEPDGYDDALMLDWRGQIAESTGANIFLARKRRAAYADARLLSRRHYPALGHGTGQGPRHRDHRARHHARRDGGLRRNFRTGTAAEVTPVSQIDDLRFQVGPIARQMMGDYEALVHRRAAA